MSALGRFQSMTAYAAGRLMIELLNFDHLFDHLLPLRIGVNRI
jgi:hypothetical protein